MDAEKPTYPFDVKEENADYVSNYSPAKYSAGAHAVPPTISCHRSPGTRTKGSRHFLALLLVPLVSALLTSCGGGSPNAGGAPTQPGTPSVPPTPPSANTGPVVTIAAVRPTASETYTAADTGVFVIRAVGAHRTQLLVSLTLGGTAVNGADYSLERVVSVPIGADSAMLRVLPFSDGVVEGDESLVLTVVPGDGRVGLETLYTVGAQSTATVTFKDAISETLPFVIGTPFRGRLARRAQVDTFVVDLTSSQSARMVMTYVGGGSNSLRPVIETVHPPGPRVLSPLVVRGDTLEQAIGGGGRSGTWRILVSHPSMQGGYTYYQMLITRTP